MGGAGVSVSRLENSKVSHSRDAKHSRSCREKSNRKRECLCVQVALLRQRSVFSDDILYFIQLSPT